MRAALREAVRGLGSTSPNPAVGAVIVRCGKIIARGHHRFFGGPHAEIVALKRSKGNLTGATMFVTLEPCDHFGKTPPCTREIIRSGIRRVVVGISDPHRIVAGKGIRRLQAAGIQVELLDDPAVFDFYEPYRIFHERGRCHVTLKLAFSIDGKITAPNRKWITGPAARAAVQKIRARMDAILVGRRTAVTDDPHLTVRAQHSHRAKKLVRIVLTASGRVPASIRMLVDGAAPTWIARVARGKKIPDLRHLVRTLARRGIIYLLVEGGAVTANSFLDQGLADEILLFVSPNISGPGGLDAFRFRMQSSPFLNSNWRVLDYKKIGGDDLFRIRPAKG